MRAEITRWEGSDRRTELEDAVFDALGDIYDLPPAQAVEAAQIAAFLADVARLNCDPAQSDRAREALGALSGACRELLDETDAASLAAARALARIEAIGARVSASPLAISARLD